MIIKNKKFMPQAVFSDCSRNFLSNPMPVTGESIIITIRTAADNVSAVKILLFGAKDVEMRKNYSDGLFDYWQAEILINEAVRYQFAIYAFGEYFIYNQAGLQKEIDASFDFVIVPGFDVPTWAQNAVMYQIFIDRFCNGNQQSDVLTDAYEYLGIRSKRMKWDDPVEAVDIANFYGGDLEGIIQKVDYLADLGIEAIYLNPIFASPSTHKYDIADYNNIDPHFGDNALFATLVQKCHAKGIRVILDGVFNHCGHLHPWVKRKKGCEDYLVWNGDKYEAWWGHENHPKLNFEGSQKLYDEILQVSQKWLLPPYNADGWRLDVAADLGQSKEFNHKFWKDFRQSVKNAKPDAFILSEHYGDPADWLDGKQWDSIMNYDAFMEPISWFFTGMQKHSESFDSKMLNNALGFKNAMQYFMARLPGPALSSAMNQLSNHDHSRFLTRTNMRAGRLHTHGTQAANEGLNPAIMLAAIALQFTWPGCPTIYYGDEAGLAGWTDPDNRRTYPWGNENQVLLGFHKEIIKLHKNNSALRGGSLEFLHTDHGVLAYARWDSAQSIICVFNNSHQDKFIPIPAWIANIPPDAPMTRIMLTTGGNFITAAQDFRLDAGMLFITLPPTSCAILRTQ